MTPVETIIALGNGGDGVVERGGRKTFVPFALPGETIQANRLIQASPDRTWPPCPHHGDMGRSGCGGCRMQHLDMQAYAEWKSSLVTHALSWTGIDHAQLDPLHISPQKSRRRATLTAERRAGRLCIGFNRRGTHSIVDLQTCLILKPELFGLLDPLRRLPLLREGERADILLAISGKAIDMVLERRRDPDLGEREALASFAQDQDIARISWRKGPRQPPEPVCHRAPFTAAFGNHQVPLPPGGFMQATGDGEAALVSFMRQALQQDSRTIDLFAGSGTFTFPALLHGPVHAVEVNAEAVAAIAAVKAVGVTAERRDLFGNPVSDFASFAAAIMDPPYTGAEAQSHALAVSGPPTVISISCNPVTFARDAAILAAGGYRIERLVPIDQFLWSAEVEVVAVLRRDS